jgi:chemotaxis protein methyltransferase CheR
VASDKLNPDYHYLHGAILQEMGFIEEAVASMVRAVFLKPDFAVVHFSLGNIARRRGRLKESQRHYKAALRILGNYGDDDTVPASEGMTAGRLMEIILSMTRKEVVNGKAQ